mmetsp:Transcript_18177/g.39600  ORF Transcript_18177/g.39600 Transcript_18177/m.39600 type:complete len:201 (+) Transcript_18177:1458-2060(+)
MRTPRCATTSQTSLWPSWWVRFSTSTTHPSPRPWGLCAPSWPSTRTTTAPPLPSPCRASCASKRAPLPCASPRRTTCSPPRHWTSSGFSTAPLTPPALRGRSWARSCPTEPPTHWWPSRTHPSPLCHQLPKKAPGRTWTRPHWPPTTRPAPATCLSSRDMRSTSCVRSPARICSRRGPRPTVSRVWRRCCKGVRRRCRRC